MKRITYIALALGLTFGAVAPAAAGGQISIQLNARNADEARAVKTGLFFYALAKHIDSGADISQFGNGNAAGIGQNGNGNVGYIDQQGNNHTATLAQNGNNNGYGIFQGGTGTNGHVSQNGNNGAGLLFQYAWN